MIAPRKIPLAVNTFSKQDLQLAAEVLLHGHLTMDTFCENFEREFASYLGRKHAVFVNSGSSANLLAFFLLSNPDYFPLRNRPWHAGCEVIVPALTWSTSIWPIVQAGGVPVFVDSDPYTLQMKSEQVAAAVTDKTVAVMVPHIMGSAVEMTLIESTCAGNDLWMIEDTCEALGVRHQGKLTGTFGDLSTFSFYFSHHITTIEGGMVTTNEDHAADLLRAMRAHGWIRQMSHPETYADNGIDPRYLFATTGFNLRPTEINAVLGLSQLKKLDSFNKSRNESASSIVHKIPYIGCISWTNWGDDNSPAAFGLPLICETQKDRDGLSNHLEQRGIETRPIVCGNITRHPAMRRVKHRIAFPLKGCDKVMDCGLYTGIWPGMTQEDTDYVAAAFASF